MKLHKWAIAAGVCAIAGGGIVYAGKAYLEKTKVFESLIVQAAAPHIDGALEIGKARIGFFAVNLKKVRLRLPSQAFSLTIDELRVNLSPLKLLRNGFSINKSVSRIVLVGPTVVVSFPPPSGESGTPPLRIGVKNIITQFTRQLGVDYLYVKNGRFRIRDWQGTAIDVGDDLAGRLCDTGATIECDVSGKLGARRKNIFLSGRFPAEDGRNIFSVLLEKAEVRQPIALDKMQIVGGTLTGFLRATFPDSLTVADIKSQGWLAVDRGAVRVDGVKKPFDQVRLHLSLANTRVTLDSLAGSHAAARFTAAGRWDLAGLDPASDRIAFQCKEIRPDAFRPLLDSNSCRQIAGTGRGGRSCIRRWRQHGALADRGRMDCGPYG